MDKWEKAFMETAETFAKLSTAERLKVGAVIVKDNLDPVAVTSMLTLSPSQTTQLNLLQQFLYSANFLSKFNNLFFIFKILIFFIII